MKFSPAATFLLTGTYIAAAIGVPYEATVLDRGVNVACERPVVLNASTNIWKSYSLHPDAIYQNLLQTATTSITDADLKQKALKLASVGTFVRISDREQISRIKEVVKDVPCHHILGLVLDGLPLKKCPGTGPGPTEDPWSYAEEYIDPIAATLKANPNTAFALIFEPDAILDVVANGTLLACQQLVKSYRTNVPYALRALNLPNVIQYLDACHGGCFGWKKTQKPGAQELINTWTAAGKPSQFRGVAVNVAGYNAWNLSPGEKFKDEDTCYDVYNPARNEKRYLQILNKTIGETDMPFHAIMDSSRAGVQGIRYHWKDYCNVNEAGFGPVFSNITKDPFLDAFVWAKWGGESDGTNDTNTSTYDRPCGLPDAFQPMPEKGQWSQPYFEMLLRNWKQKWDPTFPKQRQPAKISPRCG
ncbi:glycoside hydrolase family 6 protein [Lophiostoma macrostomum CBS 122681]|uniref:Glucanase n=1 Tax=Lophiostoma macrostomum CBS 122681 TaxID=1314788 RepID=A0A6A6T0X7_9PLEO|nr:glycoside hydrolase family 6 protein [Lophiostoma macrostomum CBS 122681]